MNALAEHYLRTHRVKISDDGSNRVDFRWHWPRGTFDRRMSALEIAAFIMPHMAHILPFFSNYPIIHAQFSELLNRLATWPQQVLDEVHPWIRRIDHCEEDEILLLSLGAQDLPSGPVHFDMTGGGGDGHVMLHPHTSGGGDGEVMLHPHSSGGWGGA